MRWSRTPDRCSRDPPGDFRPGGTILDASSLSGSSNRSSKGASVATQPARDGDAESSLGAFRIDEGSLPETAHLSNRLVTFAAVLEAPPATAGRRRRAPRPGTGRELPARTPCWRGRLWSGCLQEGRFPDTGPATASTGRPRRECLGQGEMLRLDVDQQPGPLPWSRSNRASSGPENEPSQRWCARGSGSAAPRRNCFTLKSKLKLPSIHRQSPGRGFGEGPRWPGQAAVKAGRPLGLEGRVAGQQLVGAVATQNNLHLVSREPAQQVRRQDEASPNGSSSQAATSGSSS